MWPYLENGFYRCNQVQVLEMRSPWITLGGPKSSHQCPYKRQKKEDVNTEEEKVIWRWGRRWATSQGMRGGPRNPGRGKKKKGFSPRDFKGSMALLTPCFWTCGLQNLREYNSLVLSHQACGNLLHHKSGRNQAHPGVVLYSERRDAELSSKPSGAEYFPGGSKEGLHGGWRVTRKGRAQPVRTAWVGSTHPEVSAVHEAGLHLVILLCWASAGSWKHGALRHGASVRTLLVGWNGSVQAQGRDSTQSGGRVTRDEEGRLAVWPGMPHYRGGVGSLASLRSKRREQCAAGYSPNPAPRGGIQPNSCCWEKPKVCLWSWDPHSSGGHDHTFTL